MGGALLDFEFGNKVENILKTDIPPKEASAAFDVVIPDVSVDDVLVTELPQESILRACGQLHQILGH